MIDEYGRDINYLRISVTDRCNLRCTFCMPPEGLDPIPHEQILRYEEILQVVDAAARLGIVRYRLSGGEPLLRKGLASLVRSIVERPATTAVSLTTNGLLLPAQAADLAAAGLLSINVSLDSLRPERMTTLCRGGSPERVVAGIDAALEAGMKVKINTVLLEPVLGELEAFLDLAESRDVPIRFIEFMPLDPEAVARMGESSVRAPRLVEALSRLGTLERKPGPVGCGPSEYFAIAGRSATIGLIPALTQPFCATCNRIRLTADGRLKPCLASTTEFDVRSALRRGATQEDLMALIERTVAAKPDTHHLCEGEGPGRAMSRIGG